MAQVFSIIVPYVIMYYNERALMLTRGGTLEYWRVRGGIKRRRRKKKDKKGSYLALLIRNITQL